MNINNLIIYLRLFAGVALFLLPNFAAAQAVYTPVPANSSSGTFSGQVVSTGYWTSPYDITLSWDITLLGNDVYQYIYTLSGDQPGNAAVFNHLYIQLSPAVTAENLSDFAYNFTQNGIATSATIGRSVSANSTKVYSLIFDLQDDRTPTIEFDSSLAPAYGSFLSTGYVESISPNDSSQAYNIDFGGTPTDGLNYVPTLIAAPEPGTLFLLGSSLVLITLFKWPEFVRKKQGV